MTANLYNEDDFERVFHEPRQTEEERQAEALGRTADAARCVGCSDECECEMAELIRREGE